MRVIAGYALVAALVVGAIYQRGATVSQGGVRPDAPRPGCVDKLFPAGTRFGENSGGTELSPWSTEIQYNADDKQIKVWWSPQRLPTIEFTADLNCQLQWAARIEAGERVDHRRPGHPEFGEYLEEFERIIQGAQSNPQRYTWY